MFITCIIGSLVGCGILFPTDAGDTDTFLGMDATRFGSPEAVPLLGDSSTSASSTMVLPEDLVADVSEEAYMTLSTPDFDIDGADAGRVNPNSKDGSFHVTITFHLAPRGENACTSSIVVGPYELTISRGKIDIGKNAQPLSAEAVALIRSGRFEVCVEGFADFSGVLDMTKLMLEFGRLKPEDTRAEVCHISPGNHGARHTITIASSALQAHLAHGDTLGACEATIQELQLASVCSDDPTTQRRWQISNPNDAAIDVTWELFGTAQTGSLSAPPGDSEFTTETIDGTNTVIIRWFDENSIQRSAARTSSGLQCDPDADGDGVTDSADTCANTPAGETVDATGCSCSQLDPDADGVDSCTDTCPDTPADETADANGCSCSQLDEDSDGINDCEDICPGTTVGAPVDAMGCEIMVADAGADVTLEEVGPVTLQGSASGGESPYTYYWSAPGWDGAVGDSITVMVSVTTTFTLTVTDWSFPPQTATDTVVVTVTPREGLQYTIANLGSLSARNSYATGLNNHGQVVGRYVTDAWATHPFLYSNGVMTDLGTLGGTNGEALDINDAGQVVGRSQIASGDWHAFVWDSTNGMQDLGTLGGASSEAYAINSAGQIAGFAETLTANQAFIYDNNVMTAVDTTGFSQSAAFDINSSGHVAGILLTASGSSVAFMHDGTLTNLGSPLLTSSEAWLINDSGVVAGHSWASGEYRSFLYIDGWTVDLGSITGFAKTYAWGLSSTGQVVGNAANTSGIPLSHAFVYTGGALYDLNNLLVAGHGWESLVAAYAVNDSGQIVGYGKIDGLYRAFLLTPVP
jgi:probable HAF family extracellular repeat protein